MQNCRFAFAVHVMAVLAVQQDEYWSSSELAGTVNTNPVVIRRLLIDLQGAGLIRTQRGPRGGAILNRQANLVRLADIYSAVSTEDVFRTHPNQPSSECPVGKRIEGILATVQAGISRAIIRELEQTTLADLVEQVVRGG